ncbi:MAG: ubiquinone/menaquinone biosynthesis methyltransferase [Anaerolineales bacterium]|nr:ubiquinone/menaquinone biosynthesis methyltransferase [Anaerolineales bacterium]
MTHLSGSARSQYVQGMFSRIASHYDLMNRLMTFGQDRYWRREVIARAKLAPTGSILLDLGGGTGDLGLDAYQRNPATLPIEADFTLEMMRVGQERSGAQALRWSAADASNLPFPDNTFDAVVSGFLLRNVVDLPRALSEQYRVIKPGGHLVALDTTRPKHHLLTPFVRFHMHVVIPLLGRLISGQDDAYLYLPASSEGFLSAEELVAQIASAGFAQVAFRRLNFGTIAIHWGRK